MFIKAESKISKIIFLNSEHENVDFKSEDSVVTFKKQILKHGVFKAPPPNEDVDIDFNDELFDAIIKAFDENALDNVPIILGTHDEEKVERIIGKVTKLSKEKDGLYALMAIVDEEVISKIDAQIEKGDDEDSSGLIDEVSVGLGFNHSLDTGETYEAILFHVAVVAHAWYRNMSSFEKIAALFKSGSKPILIHSVNSLEESANKVRRAFYNSVSNNYVYYVEGIYDNFVIIYNDQDGFLYRYAYTEDSDSNITFEDPTRVEKEFVEAKIEMDPKDLITGLKEVGIEVKDVEALKAMLNKVDKSEDELSKVNAALSKVNAALNPDKADEKPDLSKISSQVSQFTATVTEQSEKIKELGESLISNEAEQAVKELVNDGKVVPAKREHYVNLYKKDRELFASLTADVEKVVKTGQEGLNSGLDDNDGDKINVDKEVERITASLNGKKS